MLITPRRVRSVVPSKFRVTYLTVDCGVGCVKDQSSSVGLDSCGAARTGAS